MRYFEIIFQSILSVYAVFLLYISIPVFKNILKSAKLEIRNLKKKTQKNKIDETKVGKDFILDKPNLVEKLIEDIYGNDCSKFGSRGKKIKIGIENYVIEIDNVRIIQHTGTAFYYNYFEIDILISPEEYEIIYKEHILKKNIYLKKGEPPQPINVSYPINDNFEQYKVFLNGLPPHFNKIIEHKRFEIERYRLTLVYSP